ncbi:queuine tRNA-ribosyltransferase, putative [Plasmodium sp. gorilla clade G1]|nr:queuine tRNA-ribosyltransferase, putative [Plasmodium sp. gorilla clade G1]
MKVVSCNYRVRNVKDIETPTYTILTNNITPEYINLELLRKIDKKFIINCSLLEIYNNLDVFEKAKEYFSSNKTNEVSGHYLHQFCDFQDSYRYLNIRNVLVDDYNINVHKFISLKYDNSTAVFSIDDYIKCLKIFEPDIFCIPCEEIKINEQVGKKKKNRIINLMNEFLEKVQIIKNTNLSNSLCILSIPCTVDIDTVITETINKYDSIIDGILLSGLGYDESNETRTNAFKNILNILPNNKLKFIQLSNGNPIEILHAIYHGIDVIEPNFPYYLAKNGKAINMNLKMDNLQDGNEYNLQDKNNDNIYDINLLDFKNDVNFIIDLNNPKYVSDHSTITCNSPRKESKSYIHHLLKCHELTAHVILTYHNLYIYRSFFQEIQLHIKENNFLSYINWFIEKNELNKKEE